jgi:hypothetical protein
VQQRKIYTQLIHRMRGRGFGQLVGDLWITREQDGRIPHGGLQTLGYIQNTPRMPSILSKLVASHF